MQHMFRIEPGRTLLLDNSDQAIAILYTIGTEPLGLADFKALLQQGDGGNTF